MGLEVWTTNWTLQTCGLTSGRQVPLAGLKTSGTYRGAVRIQDSAPDESAQLAYSQEQGGGSRLNLPAAQVSFQLGKSVCCQGRVYTWGMYQIGTQHLIWIGWERLLLALAEVVDHELSGSLTGFLDSLSVCLAHSKPPALAAERKESAHLKGTEPTQTRQSRLLLPECRDLPLPLPTGHWQPLSMGEGPAYAGFWLEPFYLQPNFSSISSHHPTRWQLPKHPEERHDTCSLCFLKCYLFMAMSHKLLDPNSLTRDWTCSGSFPLQWKHRVSTTGPPRKLPCAYFRSSCKSKLWGTRRMHKGRPTKGQTFKDGMGNCFT